MIAAGRQYKELAVNKLDEGFLASPAVAGKAIFLRTKTHLYRDRAIRRVNAGCVRSFATLCSGERLLSR